MLLAPRLRRLGAQNAGSVRLRRRAVDLPTTVPGPPLRAHHDSFSVRSALGPRTPGSHRAGQPPDRRRRGRAGQKRRMARLHAEAIRE